jgi:HlyD family secretion protein
MKKTIIVTAVIIAAIAALMIFNKLFSHKEAINTYVEVKQGTFEITVSNSGELLAEKSLDIMGPALGLSAEQSGNQGGNQGGGQGGNRQGSQGGSRQPAQSTNSRGGGDFHAMDFKIQDIVPEGTLVKKGNYVAQLDRTSYDNTLKDELENLTTMQNKLEMKILDTAVALTNLRDEIKNQKYTVEEAAITLDQSKFEPPSTIRQAELKLNREKRALEQKIKSYNLKKVQNLSAIKTQKLLLARQIRLVTDLQEFLAKFTVTAPSDGMVIYKKDRLGTKRKTGSSVNAFDRIIATLPDLSSMISKVYVGEIEVTRVLPGQKVSITIDAFPEKSFTGSVIRVANIGEQLPNSDAKMFEVHVRVDGSDPALRPAMTTWNKIIIKTIDNVMFIPLECVQAGHDSIPFVYKKNRTRQIVMLGEQNDKFVIIEQGLEPGTNIYLTTPEDPGKFRLVGENLVHDIKEKN